MFLPVRNQCAYDKNVVNKVRFKKNLLWVQWPDITWSVYSVIAHAADASIG